LDLEIFTKSWLLIFSFYLRKELVRRTGEIFSFYLSKELVRRTGEIFGLGNFFEKVGLSFFRLQRQKFVWT